MTVTTALQDPIAVWKCSVFTCLIAVEMAFARNQENVCALTDSLEKVVRRLFAMATAVATERASVRTFVSVTMDGLVQTAVNLHANS